jgi:hypothetical protein
MQEYATLVQYGGIGVALAALWIIYKMQNGQRTEFMEELKANRQSNAEQSELNRSSMEKMAEGANATARALAKLTTRIQTLPQDRRLSNRPKALKNN